MRVLSWNIMHGGGTRIARIVEAIAGHDPDVIALTEFRTRAGEALCDALKAKGWLHVESTSPAGSDNGVCVISRTRMHRKRPSLAPPENSMRWLDVELP